MKNISYEDWLAWWQGQAPTYFTDKIWEFSRPDLIERLSIRKDTKILELGFGYGRETYNFCKMSENVFGAELSQWTCDAVSEEMVNRKDILADPGLFVYDGIHVPYDSYFDVIYSCFVIQHLSREHAKELIKSCLSALQPNGKILFEFFGDPEYWNNYLDVYSGIPEHGGMYNNAYMSSELETFIAACGGKVVWIKPWKITNEWGNNWVLFGRAENELSRVVE